MWWGLILGIRGHLQWDFCTFKGSEEMDNGWFFLEMNELICQPGKIKFACTNPLQFFFKVCYFSLSYLLFIVELIELWEVVDSLWDIVYFEFVPHPVLVIWCFVTISQPVGDVLFVWWCLGGRSGRCLIRVKLLECEAHEFSVLELGWVGWIFLRYHWGYLGCLYGV